MTHSATSSRRCMKQLPSSHFRRSYLAESEPIEVTAYDKPIGYWYPVGQQPGAEVGAESVTETGVPRFTIRPVLRSRPTLSSHIQRVLDPMEIEAQEMSDGDQSRLRSSRRRSVRQPAG